MRYLILFFSIFFFHNTYSQSWYLKRDIRWSSSIKMIEETGVKEAVDFSFAEYADYENSLPFYTDVVEWYPDNLSVNVKLFSATYEPLPDKFSNESLFSGLTDEISIKSHISISRNKPFLAVSLVPFRLNTKNGKVERLTQFVLEIESKAEDLTSISAKKTSHIANSVLSTGEWYKIRIPSTGMYKLTFEQLKTIGLSDPSTLRIFGSGGGMLPEDIRKGKKDDLLPVGYYMNKGADGIFNQGDYILFYALGSDTWTYNPSAGMYVCRKNHYSDQGYYFLTCNNGSPDVIPNAPQPEGSVTFQTSQYDYYYHHEKNEVNLIKSGKDYYGEEFFDSYIQRDFEFTIPGLIKEIPVKITTNVLSRSADSAVFNLTIGGSNIETFRIRSASVGNYTSIYAYNQQKTSSFLPGSDKFTLRLQYLKREPKANGWLDFFTIFAKADLSLSSAFLTFRNNSALGDNAITSFSLGNAGSTVIIWDVTEPDNILNIPWLDEGGRATFKSLTHIPKEFVAFRTNGTFPSPEFAGTGLGKMENQNLHGISVPELLIVTHPDFLTEANRLAQHRVSNDNMSVYVTTPEKIYNEFSSGTPDVTAIRNFVKNVYDRGMNGGGDELKYLLLFGRGSYDNKGVLQNPDNFILTYQSDNSLSPVSSYVSDDFFALLDPGEQLFDGMLDIGVGRLPVTTAFQARAVVDKIIEYDHSSTMGIWRNSLCFIGDDEDNNIHFNQANQLATYVTNNFPSFNVNKIFLDAYKKVATPTGQRYPDVKKAFNEQVSRGALIINYTGHGGVEGLAHERILEISDIVNWRNKGRYPLFVTATCEFTRFDDPAKVSAGEEVLLNPQGGGIALFTTTRLVYSGPNHVLNERFFEVVFNSDENGLNQRLGDIMLYSKNRTGSGINKRNFSLIGDPSMILAYPRNNIVTDSINSVHISEPLDTLKALSKITVSGHIQNSEGILLDSFNGLLFPIVYDKPVQLTTLANDGGEKKSFSLQNVILYKGLASVNDGRFTFSFVVPKDINYAFGEGKLSYYGHDSISDASGSFQRVTIGGSAVSFIPDNNGPEVEVYMNNEFFRQGDITDANPVLFVRIKDESGVNTTGNGIGHDISAIHNNNTSAPYILNEYFQSNLDSYKGGKVEYPLFNLDEGTHFINVKVWDIHNNSGEGFVEFVVAKSEEFFLNEIFNYPNPFSDRTWFSFGHNMAGADLEIAVDIFDLNGEQVTSISAREYGAGFRSQPIEWDGKSDGGVNLRQGIYIYRITVRSIDGSSAYKSGKLLIVR